MPIEKLYNGIEFDTSAVTRPIDKSDTSVRKALYLSEIPETIPVDTGRQLFVDDFLIESTSLQRSFHSAKVHPGSPVVIPENKLEMNDGHCPLACPFSDGLWYDTKDKMFKLWYHAGWFDGTALAVSKDGLNWEKPDFGIRPGTNAVIPEYKGRRRDGCTVWIDDRCDPKERYKMFLFHRAEGSENAELLTSSDGINWDLKSDAGDCGDNSGFFYNPFRNKFCFSIRQAWNLRARAYYENEDFIKALSPKKADAVAWLRTDELDKPDPLIDMVPELYDFNASPYESLMIGGFAIFYGPQNGVCFKTGHPKIIDLQIGFSRDGFNWDRPNRESFIASSREYGTWDYGYIHPASGLCTVMDDELWFYYGAFSGKSPVLNENPDEKWFAPDNPTYAGGTTGLATLRRDGFASMDGGFNGGNLLTRKLTFNGSQLFVNADLHRGELKAELQDGDGNVIPGFDVDKFKTLKCINNTKEMLSWDGKDSLTGLAGKKVRIKFYLNTGRLYSFWISKDKTGKSGGYVAAGGPGFESYKDI